MGQDNVRKPLRGWRLVVASAFLIVVLGIWVDLTLGLPITRDARSAGAWLIGVLGLATLYVVGEMLGSWIIDRDRVTDPAKLRLFRVFLLLVFVVAGTGAVILLLKATTSAM